MPSRALKRNLLCNPDTPGLRHSQWDLILPLYPSNLFFNQASKLFHLNLKAGSDKDAQKRWEKKRLNGFISGPPSPSSLIIRASAQVSACPDFIHPPVVCSAVSAAQCEGVDGRARKHTTCANVQLFW